MSSLRRRSPWNWVGLAMNTAATVPVEISPRISPRNLQPNFCQIFQMILRHFLWDIWVWERYSSLGVGGSWVEMILEQTTSLCDSINPIWTWVSILLTIRISNSNSSNANIEFNVKNLQLFEWKYENVKIVKATKSPLKCGGWRVYEVSV